MYNTAMDNEKRTQAVDLITLAMSRLQRVFDSPQTSSYHSEAKIALRVCITRAVGYATKPITVEHCKKPINPTMRLSASQTDGSNARVFAVHILQMVRPPGRRLRQVGA